MITPTRLEVPDPAPVAWLHDASWLTRLLYRRRLQAYTTVRDDYYERLLDEYDPGQKYVDSLPRDALIRERNEELDAIVAARLSQGYQLVNRNRREASAVLVRPADRVNHILHLLLSLLTVGCWVVVWVVLGVTHRRERRLVVTIDQYGSLIEERV